MEKRMRIKITAENNKEISDNWDSELFTAIVATAPGSLGRHLIFANITGINGINGDSR